MKIKNVELLEIKQYQSFIELICAVKYMVGHVCPAYGCIAVTLPNYMVMPFMTTIDCEWDYVEYNPNLYDEHYIIINADMDLSCEPAYRVDNNKNKKYTETEAIMNFVHNECGCGILDTSENIVIFSMKK